jgi:hypothetical protein
MQPLPCRPFALLAICVALSVFTVVFIGFGTLSSDRIYYELVKLTQQERRSILFNFKSLPYRA